MLSLTITCRSLSRFLRCALLLSHLLSVSVFLGAEHSADQQLLAAIHAADPVGVQTAITAGAKVDGDLLGVAAWDYQVWQREQRNLTASDLKARAEAIMQLLLTAGAQRQIDAADNYEADTAAMLAVRAGNLVVLPILQAGGANLNQQNNDGDTALSLACALFDQQKGRVGLEQVVAINRFLIDAGTDVNLADSVGATPLMRLAEAYARNYDYYSNNDQFAQDRKFDLLATAHSLFTHGARLTAEDFAGRTAYDYAQAKGQDADELNEFQIWLMNNA